MQRGMNGVPPLYRRCVAVEIKNGGSRRRIYEFMLYVNSIYVDVTCKQNALGMEI